MNLLLRKEFRLLLPAWVAALLTATLPLWAGEHFQGLAVPCFALAALFLGLTPFGLEMNWGTFGLLLSQPEKRERFWRMKTRLLGLAMLSAWALFALCWWISSRHQDRWFEINMGSFSDIAVESALLALLAYSGGLWSTLLLRDVTTAFFATILTPLAILGGALLCLGGFQFPAGMIVFSLLAVCYVVAGVLGARRLFLGAQDAPWAAGQTALAAARGGPFRWLAFGFREIRGPWSALIYKELQLQELMVILAPLLAFLHLAAMVERHYVPDWPAHTKVLEFAAFLWMVAPFVIGCVAVAEERRYNTLEGLLCLPVRKRSQFAAKFVVVMIMGMVLGGVFPWILENLCGGKSLWAGPEQLIELMAFAAGVTAISFFASSMSRGMLQAFTVALLFPILLGVAVMLLLDRFGSNPRRYSSGAGVDVIVWGGALFPLLTWTGGGIAYFWMVFRNYKLLRTGWRLWAGNFVRFVGVFVCVLLVASAIYARSWEYILPLEPHHGPARLSGAGQAMIAGSGWDGHVYALLPDGRLWAGRTDQARPDRRWKNLAGRFIGGSNWMDIAASDSEGAAALKADGTLWRFFRKGESGQVGSDSDWKKVVAGSTSFLALKQDGTIWGWGYDDFGVLPSHLVKNGRPVAIADPVQLWPNSDWVDVLIPNQEEAMAVKRDGTLWTWGFDGRPVNERITNYSSYHRLVPFEMGGTNWSSLAGDRILMIGIRTDGTLWTGGRRFGPANATDMFGSPMPRRGAAKMVRMGTNSDWVSVSRGAPQLVALEADGEFWAIDRLGQFQTQRPSRYHDWLAASAEGFTFWALAKDGTISSWADVFQVAPDGYEGFSDYGESHLFHLRPSRRPLASINILDKP